MPIISNPFLFRKQPKWHTLGVSKLHNAILEKWQKLRITKLFSHHTKQTHQIIWVTLYGPRYTQRIFCIWILDKLKQLAKINNFGGFPTILPLRLKFGEVWSDQSFYWHNQVCSYACLSEEHIGSIHLESLEATHTLSSKCCCNTPHTKVIIDFRYQVVQGDCVHLLLPHEL